MMDITPEEAERLQKLTQSPDPQTQAEMPRYQCHKKVWALKIATIMPDSTLAQREGRETTGGSWIEPADTGFAPFQVTAEYVKKHAPEVGGYYVVYADGYKSYSPAKAFEDGYTRINSKRPTILELEAILKSDVEYKINVQADGSILASPI